MTRSIHNKQNGKKRLAPRLCALSFALVASIVMFAVIGCVDSGFGNNTGGAVDELLRTLNDKPATSTTPKKFTVSFSASGWTKSPVTVDSGVTLGKDFPPNLIMAGHTFEGWYDGNTKYTAYTEITKTVTLVAKWTVNAGVIEGGNLTFGGQRYRLAAISGKIWMAENLNLVVADSSRCYGNAPDNCVKYGRLYTWNHAMSVCSSIGNGWRLPDEADLDHLLSAARGTGIVVDSSGRKLKSQTGWDFDGNGEDALGFAALPGGYCTSTGCSYIGERGEWWSAMEESGANAQYWFIRHNFNSTTKTTGSKSYMRSVRCVMNAQCDADTHYWSNWTIVTPATCTAPGQRTRSCSSCGETETQTIAQWGSAQCAVFSDPRDGQSYRTAEIGNQTWMAENVNHVTESGSFCYSNNNSNCTRYGRLYTWDAALEACPAGWRLPGRAEWDVLLEAVGGIRSDSSTYSIAGTKLKSAVGWRDFLDDYARGNGTDDFAFSALPGGLRDTNGVFGLAGNFSYWWSATEFGSGRAYARDMVYFNENVRDYHNDKRYGFSVRCVQDVRP